MPGPKCFFDMTADGKSIGRIVMALHADVCPKTCGKINSLLIDIMNLYLYIEIKKKTLELCAQAKRVSAIKAVRSIVSFRNSCVKEVTLLPKMVLVANLFMETSSRMRTLNSSTTNHTCCRWLMP